jgi:hypothetical protein
MVSRFRLPLFLAASGLFLTGGHLLAQGAGAASATFRPALLDNFTVGTSFTARDDLRGPGVAGDVAVTRFDLSLAGRTPLGASTVLVHGLAYARHDLNRSGLTRLPDTLQELTLSLGLQHRASATWQVAAYLRPGLYGDELGWDSGRFNAPLLATAIYATGPDLAWIVGFTANAASDRAFLPIAGVRWQFAPAWTFNLGFPRAGLEYRPNERVSYHGGATVQGGGYYITGAGANPVTGPLRRTWLEYREIRLGGGAVWTLSESATLTLDVGVVAQQRFDYFDRDFKVKGGHPFFGALSWQGRF